VSGGVLAHALRAGRTRKNLQGRSTWTTPEEAILFPEAKLNMRNCRIVASLSLCFVLVSLGIAQQPAPAPVAVPPIPSTGFAGLDQYRARRIAVFTDDYGQLARYHDADAALPAPAPNENRVVFFGDSITDIWKLDDYFSGKPYINRGIGGQTTPQMLVRYRQDVIDLQPKVVVVLAGTNDIAGNTGPMRNEDIEANYASMAELARLHGIRMVFASLLPVHDYTEKAKDFFAQRPRERILALNQWLKGYCQGSGDLYLDYFSAMVDDKGMMKKDLSDDGLHPNAAGFKVMAPLAESAIQKALTMKP
jgi:lysophospholipase L1-like esterase